MKLLVIGIDGGDEHIFQHMPMPTLHELRRNLVSLKIVEDLWSRGWAHILCGEHGRESGAFYTKPIVGEVGKFTQSFKASDYAKNPNLVTLWQLCADSGITPGFMNIPTTMPAPKIKEGFFVSGAGAGFSGSGGGGIPDAVANRTEVKELLAETDYIFDTRFRASGIRKFGDFVTRLNEMQRKRTAIFIRLAQQYDIQFGFVAFMALRALLYLALYEVMAYIENGHPQNKVQEQLLTVFRVQDECIARLIAELNPDKIMFVSDHGMSPYKYSLNITPFLRQIGVAHPKSGRQGVSRLLIKKLGSRLPTSLKRQIGEAAPKEVVASVRGPDIDWETSTAFGSRYISGIYVNDERFGGVVRSQAESDALVNQIVTAFNDTTVAKEHGATAVPYRSRFTQAVYQELLPDIWLDRPDAIFFENKGDFLGRNLFYGPITSIADAPRDQYTGIKGRYPLLLVHSDSAAYAKEHDVGPKDLTLAYRLIKRVLQI